MATEQIQTVEINDTETHDYIFHLPDQRVKNVTLWVENINPLDLSGLVLIKSVNQTSALRAYPLSDLFKGILSEDGTAAILYNIVPITGIFDIGLRLRANQAPSEPITGTITLSAYAESGAL